MVGQKSKRDMNVQVVGATEQFLNNLLPNTMKNPVGIQARNTKNQQDSVLRFALGAGGRWFKSIRPDYQIQRDTARHGPMFLRVQSSDRPCVSRSDPLPWLNKYKFDYQTSRMEVRIESFFPLH